MISNATLGERDRDVLKDFSKVGGAKGERLGANEDSFGELAEQLQILCGDRDDIDFEVVGTQRKFFIFHYCEKEIYVLASMRPFFTKSTYEDCFDLAKDKDMFGVLSDRNKPTGCKSENAIIVERELFGEIFSGTSVIASPQKKNPNLFDINKPILEVEPIPKRPRQRALRNYPTSNNDPYASIARIIIDEIEQR